MEQSIKSKLRLAGISEHDLTAAEELFEKGGYRKRFIDALSSFDVAASAAIIGEFINAAIEEIGVYNDDPGTATPDEGAGPQEFDTVNSAEKEEEKVNLDELDNELKTTLDENAGDDDNDEENQYEDVDFAGAGSDYIQSMLRTAAVVELVEKSKTRKKKSERARIDENDDIVAGKELFEKILAYTSGDYTHATYCPDTRSVRIEFDKPVNEDEQNILVLTLAEIGFTNVCFDAFDKAGNASVIYLPIVNDAL